MTSDDAIVDNAGLDIQGVERGSEPDRPRPKIAVYAIALDEAAHVERWCLSAADADYLVVADTGSKDDTVSRLRERGVRVHDIRIRPWRFDDARNACLALVPHDVDICVSLDMDEVMLPMWRANLEAAWTPGTTRLFYNYGRGLNSNNRPAHTFRRGKIHSRFGYRWERVVHEDLRWIGGEERHALTDDVLKGEIQDQAKDRSSYLPLLRLARQENTADAQICFWLARELMYHGLNEESAETHLAYLDLPTATWPDERAEAMRYLARVQPARASDWLLKSVFEAPYRRELWCDLAEHYHSEFDWLGLFWACSNGIEKCHRTGTYLDDPAAWNYRLFDLGALACSRIGFVARAVDWGRKALELVPEDRRLSGNLVWYRRQEREERGTDVVEASSSTPSKRQTISRRFNICHIDVNVDSILFGDLIEVVRQSLLELGHSCSLRTNAVDRNSINIVIGSTLLANEGRLDFIGDVPYIAYQLEQLDIRRGHTPSFPHYMNFIRRAAQIYEYSPANVAFLEKEGLGDRVAYVPPAYHASLEQLAPAITQDIDVLFYGLPMPRRDHILGELRARGVKACHLFKVYGQDLMSFVNRSKIVLNIHAHDHLDTLETLRLSMLLANGRFVVSEVGDHNPYGNGLVYARYDDLVAACMSYLGPKAAERDTIASLGRENIRRTSFVAELEKAIKAMDPELFSSSQA